MLLFIFFWLLLFLFLFLCFYLVFSRTSFIFISKCTSFCAKYDVSFFLFLKTTTATGKKWATHLLLWEFVNPLIEINPFHILMCTRKNHVECEFGTMILFWFFRLPINFGLLWVVARSPPPPPPLVYTITRFETLLNARSIYKLDDSGFDRCP